MVANNPHIIDVTDRVEPCELALVILHIIEGELHIICCEQFSVMPSRILVKIKRPCLTIVRDLPAICKSGYDSVRILPC